MPVRENSLVDLENFVATAMKHRGLECFHCDGDHLKDVMFKS